MEGIKKNLFSKNSEIFQTVQHSGFIPQEDENIQITSRRQLNTSATWGCHQVARRTHSSDEPLQWTTLRKGKFEGRNHMESMPGAIWDSWVCGGLFIPQVGKIQKENGRIFHTFVNIFKKGIFRTVAGATFYVLPPYIWLRSYYCQQPRNLANSSQLYYCIILIFPLQRWLLLQARGYNIAKLWLSRLCHAQC